MFRPSATPPTPSFLEESTDTTVEDEFVSRAAGYLRQSGMSDNQIERALMSELGLPLAEAQRMAVKA